MGGLISVSHPTEQPFIVTEFEMNTFQPAQTPQGFLSDASELTPAAQKRLEIIRPLLEQDCAAVMDRELRHSVAQKIAGEHSTTVRRVLRLYYRYLATGQLILPKNRKPAVNDVYEWAIRKFYFSAKKFSLRAAYDMMLVQKYAGPNGGKLPENVPSWHSFRGYYYKRGCHKDPRRTISRSGLTDWQRNSRPAFGTASDWRDRPGSYQMDATPADVYLVSRHDRSKVIGRPYVYLAVDTDTQLIAGLYVGLECDETAALLCFANAVRDKVSYCREYGIEIRAEQWPGCGMPYEIITDNGNEFSGSRMLELCRRYGLEIQSLPPFRPDEKGLVEKSFDLIQQRYRPFLAGKGLIEPDAQERWAEDYRSQSVLNLDEFTKIVIHCVLYLNSGRPLENGETAAQRWLASSPSLPDVPFEELLLMALPREQAKLMRKGCRVNRLLYVPEDMSGLILNQVYTVSFSPSDMSCAYILTDDGVYRKCLLASPCRHYSGLSQQEADVQRKEEQQRKREAEKRKTAASMETIRNIQSVLQDALAADTKKPKQDGKEIRQNRNDESKKLT